MSDDRERFMDALWPIGLPDGEALSFSFRRAGQRALTTVERSTVTELVEASARVASGCDVWVNVATRPKGQKSRGGLADCRTVPALWADLDVQEGAPEGVHKGAAAFDTWAEAMAFVDAFPLRPSMLVRTGYGLSAWWLLAEPAAAELVAPHVAALKATMARLSGGRADPSVYEVSRMMRLPGTQNVKVAGAVQEASILWLTELRYGLDDLEMALDLPEAPPQRRAAPRTAPGGSGRPGEDYDAHATAAEIVELLARHGAEEVGRTSAQGRLVVRMARPGKGTRNGPSLTVGFVAENVTHVFTSGWPELPAGAWTPFRLRAQLDHGGDWAACARALAAEGYGATRGDSSEFFNKDGGFQAQKCADAVLERATIGRLRYYRDADDGGALWFYEGGAWRPGGAWMIEREVAGLLGERLRMSHVATVQLAIRTRPDLTELDDGPPHPEFLNFPNGMLEWRTGRLVPHGPEYKSTVQLGVEYDPEAACPRFDAWLEEMLPPDARRFVEEILGYLMLAGNPLHKAFMLLGTGRNGKGTLLRFIKGLLGPNNCASVSLQTLSENRFASADLHLRLANIGGDLDARRVEDSSTFKMITGGDVIRGERKYGQPFSFTPWCVLIFSANQTPGSSDTTEGYLSRWEVLNFSTELTGKTDHRIEAAIHEAELPGLARLGVEGLRRLMERGRFDRPPSVAAAYERFSADVDQVRAWVQEQAIKDRDAWAPRADMYRNYQAWATEASRGVMKDATFYERLEMAGHRAAKRLGTRGFAGIRLRTTDDDPARGNDGSQGAGGGTSSTPNPRVQGERVETLPLLPPTEPDPW